MDWVMVGDGLGDGEDGLDDGEDGLGDGGVWIG